MYGDCLLYYFIFFFFSSRRRHTRFDCDWSSDVCSSDLLPDSRDTADNEKPGAVGVGHGSQFGLTTDKPFDRRRIREHLRVDRGGFLGERVQVDDTALDRPSSDVEKRHVPTDGPKDLGHGLVANSM